MNDVRKSQTNNTSHHYHYQTGLWQNQVGRALESPCVYNKSVSSNHFNSCSFCEYSWWYLCIDRNRLRLLRMRFVIKLGSYHPLLHAHAIHLLKSAEMCFGSDMIILFVMAMEIIQYTYYTRTRYIRKASSTPQHQCQATGIKRAYLTMEICRDSFVVSWGLFDKLAFIKPQDSRR